MVSLPGKTTDGDAGFTNSTKYQSPQKNQEEIKFYLKPETQLSQP
jgi:hypothetical protein